LRGFSISGQRAAGVVDLSSKEKSLTSNEKRPGWALFNVDPTKSPWRNSQSSHRESEGVEVDKLQTAATVLIVPGLREHVAEHWQTLLAARLHNVRSVPPLTTDKLDCGARVRAIEQQLQAIDGPVIVVAHSAGVLMVAHWAAHFAAQSRRPIKGALLVAPPDLDAPWPQGYPSPDTLRTQGWSPLPTGPLPFPSLVVASTNDHLASLEAVSRMAAGWGAELHNAGAVGHLNPAAGFGPWPLAETLIQALDR
jgi:predicted alpha/beta hydrolase family esterase